MMVAYSFRPRFVDPVLVGLGVEIPGVLPKRQTIRRWGLIRAPDVPRRHAREGEDVHLYTGQRTKACRLLGVATCIGAPRIEIKFARSHRPVSRVRIGTAVYQLGRDLDAFARADGFPDWSALRLFWHDEHEGVTDFDGVLVRWVPKIAPLERRR